MKDQLKRDIQLKKTPKRIVSLVPSQTELLVDLGLETSIVGVTKFCVHPKHLRRSKVVVGGTKQINIEKIKALKPHVILCNKEENTKAIIESLEAIAPIYISDIYNLEDCFELIKMYGAIFNVEAKASSLVLNIQNKRNAFQLQIKDKKRLKVAYFIWKNPWMVAGNNTFINHLLELNKFENMYSNQKRYPEIKLNDSVQNKDVQVVFLSSEPFPFKEVNKNEVHDFYPNAITMLVDGEMFSWYGSRLTKAFNYFKTLHLSLQNNEL